MKRFPWVLVVKLYKLKYFCATELSKILHSEVVGMSTKNSIEVIENFGELKEAKLNNVMDSKCTVDSETNKNKGNNGKPEQGSQRITRKREAQSSPSRGATNKGKVDGKKVEKKVIAIKDPLVSLMAVDNFGVIVGRGKVNNKGSTLHGQQIPHAHQVVSLLKAKSNMYKLSFPNLNDDPI
jgi:hypothetical protein